MTSGTALTATPTQEFASGPVTITYEYDELNRLTSADYSTGPSYEYTYDAVGNRLSMTDPYSVTNYQYDNANRMTSLNGVPQSYDANGNLLNDGVNTNTYDTANHLSMTDGLSTTTYYAYNGMGDRLQQTIGSTQINYAMDLNAGLTQVLDDGTNQYIYGDGRIAQVNTAIDYFLGDALGSVRQLTSASGAVTLAQSYDPYGVKIASSGAATSTFGYTGEQTDATGMIYLRARYYAPNMGRFMSRDTWGGDESRPMSFNRWSYTKGNPVNYIDPTGHYDRFAAWNYASTHDDKYAPFDNDVYNYSNIGTECASFVSSALYAGFIRDERHNRIDSSFYIWDKEEVAPDAHPLNKNTVEWYRVPELYKFLLGENEGGHPQAHILGTFTDTIPVFRQNLLEKGNQDNDAWLGFINQNIGSLEPGDLVFYKWQGSAEWDHVAMVSYWDVQTYWNSDEDVPWEWRLWSYYGIDSKYNGVDCYFTTNHIGRSSKPTVMERSGAEPRPYTKWAAGRSVDNFGESIPSEVAFMHIN